MSKKLSQAEIDALVASLLGGETTPDQAESAVPPSAQPVNEQPAASVQASPAASASPAEAAGAAGMPSGEAYFEQAQDLGPITQAEVDAAIQACRSQADGAAPVQPDPAGVREAPPAAAGQAVPSPQSRDAAAEARRALSMAALGGVLMDIELTVTVELGRARLTLGEVLALGPGSVITLDKQANTPVDVLVNQIPLMKAEVLAIAEKYGIRITESKLHPPAPRVRAAS